MSFFLPFQRIPNRLFPRRFLRYGQVLATASMDQTIKLWEFRRAARTRHTQGT
jgi:hypothetical protein